MRRQWWKDLNGEEEERGKGMTKDMSIKCNNIMMEMNE
jgi:hypothetical protein